MSLIETSRQDKGEDAKSPDKPKPEVDTHIDNTFNTLKRDAGVPAKASPANRASLTNEAPPTSALPAKAPPYKVRRLKDGKLLIEII